MRSRRPFDRLWARLLPGEGEIGLQVAARGAHAAKCQVRLPANFAAASVAGDAGAAEMIAVQVRDALRVLHRHALRAEIVLGDAAAVGSCVAKNQPA